MTTPQFIQTIMDPRGNEHGVLIYGKGDLRLGNRTYATMREVKEMLAAEFPDEGYNCSHCDTDNVAGATECAGCGEQRGSHPND